MKARDDFPALAPFPRPGAEACEYIGPQGIYWSRGATILRSDTLGGTMVPVARLPRPPARRLIGASRLGRRLARETFYNLLPMADGCLFFSFGTEIGVIRDGRAQRIAGRAQAHRILRGGVARMPDGALVFGEYRDNPAREAIRLYRLEPGARAVEEVYRFAPGAVRHVHSVRWDASAGRAVVATGDIGAECRILSFAPDFGAPRVIGAGGEDWRAISLAFTEAAIYFGTDAQYAPNRLLRYDRASARTEVLAEVNGPVYYAAPVADGWVFATTAELCPSQSSPEAILYHLSAATERVRVLARFPKDRWPKRYFQNGIVNFPIVEGGAGAIPVSGTALAGLDARMVLLGAA